MLRALSLFVPLVLALVPAPAAAQSEPDETLVLPLLEAAEAWAQTDPALARAQATLALEQLPPGSRLALRARGAQMVAEASGGALPAEPPSPERVVAPLVEAARLDLQAGERQAAMRRLTLALGLLPPESELARSAREMLAPPRPLPSPPPSSHAERIVVAAPGWDLRCEDRETRRACLHARAESRTLAELEEVERRIGSTPRADDTVPSHLLGLGVATMLTGIATTLGAGLGIGCLNYQPWSCTRERHDTTVGFFGLGIALGAVGLVGTIVGGSWLRANGAPYRRRDALRRRLRLSDLTPSLEVSPDGATLGLGVSF